MVMMEEAIARASEDVDVKFRRIEAEQSFPAGMQLSSCLRIACVSCIPG